MIRFLVDSTADCPKESGLYDYLVPMTIRFEDREYLAGVELDSEKFYELLLTSGGFPQTSQPAPQAFLQAFEQVKAAGDELICFLISSALSGTYQSAVMAKQMVDYDKIHVIDTRCATHMIGLLVRHAAKLREEGRTAEEIVEAVDAMKSKVKVLAGLDTLEYLRRGGRLSNAAAVVGSLAQIKPILTVTEEGAVEAQGKAIGKTRAMQQIVDRMQSLQPDLSFPVISVYSAGEENCEQLEKRLSEAGIEVSQRLQIGSTIGCHTGPGVYGVIFVTK